MMLRRCVYAVFALLALATRAPAALAEGCPSKPVPEDGGLHRCYADKTRGHVHLWTPDGFEPKTAVTVIYVHGHNLGDDGCDNAHYVDCAWDAHGLASQFSKSGLNALFVAIEGPTSSRETVAWTSLDAVLRFVRRKEHVASPVPVVAVAHSAGIATVARFLGDRRLRHVIAVDALYQRAPKLLRRWYAASRKRRLTLVGVESRHAQTSALARKLLCSVSTDVFGPFSDVRCAAAIDPDVGHMDVIRDGRVLPGALARVRAPPPVKAVKRRTRRHRR